MYLYRVLASLQGRRGGDVWFQPGRVGLLAVVSGSTLEIGRREDFSISRVALAMGLFLLPCPLLLRCHSVLTSPCLQHRIGCPLGLTAPTTAAARLPDAAILSSGGRGLTTRDVMCGQHLLPQRYSRRHLRRGIIVSAMLIPVYIQ